MAGKGDKESADAACDAIRGMFDLMDMRGQVVIGEGIKDEAPGLFIGEKVGTWKEGSPRFEIALDPVDGTTNAAKGLPEIDPGRKTPEKRSDFFREFRPLSRMINYWTDSTFRLNF